MPLISPLMPVPLTYNNCLLTENCRTELSVADVFRNARAISKCFHLPVCVCLTHSMQPTKKQRHYFNYRQVSWLLRRCRKIFLTFIFNELRQEG